MLHVCSDCGARYAESLQACPHCGSTGRRPAYEEDNMPKIVTGVGPSNALGQPRDGDQAPDDAAQGQAAAQPAQPKKARASRAKKNQPPA